MPGRCTPEWKPCGDADLVPKISGDDQFDQVPAKEVGLTSVNFTRFAVFQTDVPDEDKPVGPNPSIPDYVEIPPMGFTLSVPDESILVVNMTWTDTAQISQSAPDSYQVYRSLNVDGPWQAVSGLLPATQLNFTDSTVTPETRYYYRITAKNGAGQTFSNVDTTYVVGLPGPFTLYILNDPSESVANLYWDASPRATSYTLYRSTTPGSGFSLLVSGLPSSQLAYDDYAVSEGVTYYYYAQAVNAVGTRDSNEVQCTIIDTCAVSGITDGGGDNFDCYADGLLVGNPNAGTGLSGLWLNDSASIDHNLTDGRVVYQDNGISRLLTIGDAWNELWIVIRLAVTDTGSTINTPPVSKALWFGVHSNPNANLANGPLGSSCSHFLGVKLGNSTWSRATIDGVVRYLSVYPGGVALKKVGAVETTSGAGFNLARDYSAEPDNLRLALAMRITKGTPYQIQTIFPQGITGTVDCTPAYMVNALNSVNFSDMRSALNGGVSGKYLMDNQHTVTVDEVADGALNALCVCWDQSNPALKLSDFYYRVKS